MTPVASTWYTSSGPAGSGLATNSVPAGISTAPAGHLDEGDQQADAGVVLAAQQRGRQLALGLLLHHLDRLD
jgi:hypothetical protein